MVEIKRTAAGQSFTNKPIGVVNVQTNREKIYQQEARNFQNASNIALDYAKNLQIKEGQEFGRTVAVRDESGKLFYPELPKSLGRYGTDSANEIMQKRYITSATNDLQAFANQAAATYQDPNEYKNVVSDYIANTSKQIEASGGSSVLGAYSESAYAYVGQQASKLALQKLQRSEELAKANTKVAIESYQSDVLSDIEAGNLSNLLGKRGALELQLDSAILEEGLPNSYKGDTLAVYSRAETTSLFKLATRNMTQAEAIKLERAVARNPEDRAEYQGEVFEALFNSFDSVSRPQAIPQTLSSINQVVTQIGQEEANKSSIAVGSDILSNNSGKIYDASSSKNQQAVDLVMSNSFGITQSLDYFETAIASDQRVLDTLTNTQVMPRSLIVGMESMATGTQGIEFTPEQYANALKIYRTSIEGQPGKTAGLGKNTLHFFSKMSALSKFNANNLDQAALFSRQSTLNDPETFSIIKGNAGVAGSSIDKVLTNYLIANLDVEPEHEDDMKAYVGSLLLAGSDTAADIAQNFYDLEYIKSPFLNGKRSFHAPERYFDREGLDAFEASVNNILYSQAMYNNSNQLVIPKLGEDVFLRVERGAQNTTEYSLVDRNGDFVRKDGEIVRVGPSQIKQRQSRIAQLTNQEILTLYEQRIRAEENNEYTLYGNLVGTYTGGI